MKKILPIVCFAVLGVWVAAQAQRNITLDGNNLFPPIPPAAGDSGALVEFEATLNAMDAVGGDVVNGLLLDFTNANHTGGTFNGVLIDSIVGDPQASEYGLRMGAGWDEGIMFDDPGEIGFDDAGSLLIHSPDGDVSIFLESVSSRYHTLELYGTTTDITNGETNYMRVRPTLVANNNPLDHRTAVLIDVDVPNGSGGYVSMLRIDEVTNDPDTTDSAISIEEGWDAHIMLEHLAAAPADNPPTGWVSVFLDDNADFDGGANDCALVWRTSAGATGAIAIIVSNGACP